jgi:hypothetical protein
MGRLAAGISQCVSRGIPSSCRLLLGHHETGKPRAGEAAHKAGDILAASAMRVDHSEDSFVQIPHSDSVRAVNIEPHFEYFRPVLPARIVRFRGGDAFDRIEAAKLDEGIANRARPMLETA